MKNCVVRRTERVRLTRQLSNGGSVVYGVCAGQNGRIRYWRYHRRKIMIQQERGKFMGGILGAYNAISDYLHTLNMGSTLFRLILAMFLGCLIGIDRGMKKRVAGVKTHMIVCMGATLVMMTGDFIHVYSNGAGIGDTVRRRPVSGHPHVSDWLWGSAFTAVRSLPRWDLFWCSNMRNI